MTALWLVIRPWRAECCQKRTSINDLQFLGRPFERHPTKAVVECDRNLTVRARVKSHRCRDSRNVAPCATARVA